MAISDSSSTRLLNTTNSFNWQMQTIGAQLVDKLNSQLIGDKPDDIAWQSTLTTSTVNGTHGFSNFFIL